jgi:hypothetical protein
MTTGSVDLALMAPLIETCSLKPFELDGSICIGDSDNASANRSNFEGDATGFEAFVNHVHLGDLWVGRMTAAPNIDLTREIAKVVIACWAVSLLPILRGRSVLFFAGGPSVGDFTLRFHVDRGPGDSWVDLGDSAFLTARGLAVWRFNDTGLESQHAW